MEVAAKIVVKSIEVNVEGKGSVTALVSFKVGNMSTAYSNSTRVTVAMTEELRRYVENVVSAQVGEIITREESQDE